jgi:hypothetical protein
MEQDFGSEVEPTEADEKPTGTRITGKWELDEDKRR